MSSTDLGGKSGDPEVRIIVTPEPDDETMAVIVAAVRHHLRVQDDDLDQEETQRPSRWVMAGRREAMQGRGNESGRDL